VVAGASRQGSCPTTQPAHVDSKPKGIFFAQTAKKVPFGVSGISILSRRKMYALVNGPRSIGPRMDADLDLVNEQ
jgi:hypothetical protein